MSLRKSLDSLDRKEITAAVACCYENWSRRSFLRRDILIRFLVFYTSLTLKVLIIVALHSGETCTPPAPRSRCTETQIRQAPCLALSCPAWQSGCLPLHCQPLHCRALHRLPLCMLFTPGVLIAGFFMLPSLPSTPGAA